MNPLAAILNDQELHWQRYFCAGKCSRKITLPHTKFRNRLFWVQQLIPVEPKKCTPAFIVLVRR